MTARTEAVTITRFCTECSEEFATDADALQCRDCRVGANLEAAVCSETRYTCPVCGYDSMKYPAADYNICTCCGVEFGTFEGSWTHAQLRDDWMQRGCPWWSPREAAPPRWDAHKQLRRAGFLPSLPNGKTSTFQLTDFEQGREAQRLGQRD